MIQSLECCGHFLMPLTDANGCELDIGRISYMPPSLRVCHCSSLLSVTYAALTEVKLLVFVSLLLSSVYSSMVAIIQCNAPQLSLQMDGCRRSPDLAPFIFIFISSSSPCCLSAQPPARTHARTHAQQLSGSWLSCCPVETVSGCDPTPHGPALCGLHRGGMAN